MIYLLIKWSGIAVTDGRGKAGGTVFSKGRSGAIARNKVTPVDRATPAMQAAKVILALFSQAFRALTVDQIAAWNSAATAGYKTTNIFGDSIAKSGINLFVQLNINLRTIFLPQISDVPVQEDVGNMVQITPTAAEGATTMFLFGLNSGGTNAVPANTTLVILACAPVSRGISFVKSQMRIISTIDAAGNTNTTNLWADYVAKFGAPVAGQKLFVGCTAVNKTTGQAGILLKQSLIVAA